MAASVTRPGFMGWGDSTAHPVRPPPVATKGSSAHAYIWNGKFGTMVIEVRGEDVYVNGQRVEPMLAGAR